MSVTNAILEAFGKELYGERWHGHVADIFGVSKRTVRRWDDGEIPLPDEAALYLHVVLVSKRDQIDRLIASVALKPTDGTSAPISKGQDEQAPASPSHPSR